MEKLSKKYKIFLSCLGILLIIGICFVFYSSNQEKKKIEQQQNIEKYVNSIIEEENNINNKLDLIKNGSMIIIGDYNYIEDQLKRMYENTIYLYSYEYKKVDYLDSYVREVTGYDNYIAYKAYLEQKYFYNEYDEFYKTAKDFINSVKPDKL